MPCQLPADCLNEIFEYLERDKVTLHSCLLVNCLWCEISVRILWRDIWITRSANYGQRRLKVNPLILNTLIICLPNNSKTLLLEKGILDSTQISKTPLFDYPSYCRVLSLNEIGQMIVDIFKSQKYLAKEIMKMFMTKNSLKKLSYYTDPNTINLSFLRYPGAKDYLTNLSKLNCSSDVKNTFFNILSQVCCNIQSLTIEFKEKFSNDLKNLISSQNNLKYLSLSQKRSHSGVFWSAITPSLAKHSKSLIKLKIHWLKFDHWNRSEQLSLFTTFTNLQEIILSFHHRDGFSGFNKLQYITFPQLQTLKFLYKCPDDDMLIKFLKNNGRNLKEFYVNSNSNLILSAIAEFCPNVKLLYALFSCDKIETYKVILNSCQQLESIETRCYYGLLSEKELLETLAKYSPKNFYRLKLINYSDSKLVPEDLEEFFTNWKDRVPQIPFSFINRGSFSLENKEGISDVIEKYKKLGTIKKFETTLY